MMIFSSFRDLAPAIILLTLTLSFILGRNITRDNLKGIDGFFAVIGFVFGILMTSMNLIYTSKDLFLLSPIITIGCIFYLRYRSKFQARLQDPLLQITNRHQVLLSLFWWLLICSALFTCYFSEVYTRHLLLFFIISGAVAVLAIQIIFCSCLNKIKTSIFIIKILFLSVILRYSAYSISPYPIGSDPWVHSEYLSNFLEYGRIAVSPDFLYYYVNYPIAHLHAVCMVLLGSISPHNAMFFLGVILTASTVVTFLIVKMFTGNNQLALLSMLILNFIDAQIQWSIMIIAMSFAIAIYAFIIFLTLKVCIKPENKKINLILLFVFFCLMVWTHTISTFITLVSIFALVCGYIIIEMIYGKKSFSIQSFSARSLILPLVMMTIITLYHWMDPSYLFFNMPIEGLLQSLSMEVKLLGGTTLSNVHGRWEEILQPVGFCIFVFFGIIGTLFSLSNKNEAKKYFPVIVLVFVLFFVRYAFPIFGMRNIIPDRWPAFAFICFALFIGVGFFYSICLLKNKNIILCAVAIFFFMGSFVMITNAVTNQDSPLFGEAVITKLIWTESEMSLYSHMNGIYDGTIIADQQTSSRIFGVYLKNKRAISYQVFSDGKMNTDLLSTGMVIWRRDSLTRPEHVRDNRFITNMLLGDSFLKYLDKNYNCISDSYTAKSYLPQEIMHSSTKNDDELF